PEAPDAFAAWGFFDAVFEQKEYAEDYVMESMAREMLAKDPALKKEFDSKLQSDTAFAKSPGSRLNFFYQHSPYWDNQVNLYPVARLMKDVPLQTDPWR
ncbi:MAG: peptidase M14, partial [Ignavibacteriales bacterium]|nr:peptidase M14 [Ignavibacteriales bacterium]